MAEGERGVSADLEAAKEAPMKEFKAELIALINRHSRENVSNTPDWVLADFMVDALEAFEASTYRREQWYGHPHEPGQAEAAALAVRAGGETK